MTLIDKAEALAIARSCPDSHWGPWIAERFSALPARGVALPTEEDREWIDARAGELFRANERIRGSVRPSTIRPQDFRDYFVVNATLERFSALPARGVGVKPLVWQFEQEDVQVANTSARHQYRVIHDRRATKGAWSWFCDGAWIGCETEEAAKAAAQADYAARILAALAPTDAAQASAENAHVKGETAGQMLERLGMDGVKWAAEFRTTALRLGYSDMDEGWLIGWFCNAIMAGYDRSAAQARAAALREAAAVFDDFGADLVAKRRILALLSEART